MLSTRNWISGLAALVAVSMAFGCGDDGPDTVAPGDDTQQYLDQMDGYESWETFNDEPIFSGSHAENFVITYANDVVIDARDESGEEGFAFPEGSVLVKEVMPEEDGDVEALDAMAKRSDEEGDWHWVKATADRQQIVNDIQGDVSMCSDCHAGDSAYDYVFLDDY